jgi:peptidoglycan hydrolase CwlO-like protein
VYKSGNVAFIDVLVGVDNFSEFASRLDLWMRLLDQERGAAYLPGTCCRTT